MTAPNTEKQKLIVGLRESIVRGRIKGPGNQNGWITQGRAVGGRAAQAGLGKSGVEDGPWQLFHTDGAWEMQGCSLSCSRLLLSPFLYSALVPSP